MISIFLGAGLLLLVGYDVYVTTLHARGKSGPLTDRFTRTVWKVTRVVAFKLPRSRRHKLLNGTGPALMPCVIIGVITLEIIGFSLIYLSGMPQDFYVQSEARSSNWIESLYFSGATLTTLGYGDLSPRTIVMRGVALVEAASGLALISLIITYLVAVYRALERKRAFALSFYHQAEGGANVVGFISHHFVNGKFVGIQANLRSAARDMQEVLESHIEHPIIHYFHPTEVYKGLPRVLFLALETVAVISSCLDKEKYSELYNHPNVVTLGSSARHVLSKFISLLGLERAVERSEAKAFNGSLRWRRRFDETILEMRDAGIATEPDTEAAWQIYQHHRAEWEKQLYHFSRFLGYDWDEVTGDIHREAATELDEETRRVKFSMKA